MCRRKAKISGLFYIELVNILSDGDVGVYFRIVVGDEQLDEIIFLEFFAFDSDAFERSLHCEEPFVVFFFKIIGSRSFIFDG